MHALFLAAALSCPAIGTRRTLLSTDYDARVIVWRDRRDLHRYQGSQEADVSSDAAFVVHPLTQAVVVQCPLGDPHSIGVKITQGPAMGQYGWVDSGDVNS